MCVSCQRVSCVRWRAGACAEMYRHTHTHIQVQTCGGHLYVCMSRRLCGDILTCTHHSYSYRCSMWRYIDMHTSTHTHTGADVGGAPSQPEADAARGVWGPVLGCRGPAWGQARQGGRGGRPSAEDKEGQGRESEVVCQSQT